MIAVAERSILSALVSFLKKGYSFRPLPSANTSRDEAAIRAMVNAWGYMPSAVDAQFDRENVRSTAIQGINALRELGWTPPNQ